MFVKTKQRLALLALACGTAVAISLLAILPGGLQTARGQTFQTIGTTPTFFVVCPNGSVLPIIPGFAFPSCVTTTTTVAAVPTATTTTTTTAAAPILFTTGTQVCNGQSIPANQLCIITTSPFGAPTGVVVPLPSTSTTTTTSSGGVTAPPFSAGTSPTSTAVASGCGPTTGTAATSESALSPAPPTSVLPASPVFQGSTTDTFTASSAAWVGVCGSPDVTSPAVQLASVGIPAGAACGGKGDGSITLTASDQGQPLGATLAGTCGSGSSGTGLTLSAPAKVCVTIAQYILDAEKADGGTGLVLINSSGNILSNSAVSGSQVCATTTSTGTFTVAVLLPPLT